MKPYSIARLKELVAEGLNLPTVGNDFLDRRYQDQVGIIGHVNPYYRMFYLIAREYQPTLCVELGSWQATASAHLAWGSPGGKVVTIDIHKDGGDGEAKTKEACAHLPNLTYIHGWTWDVVRDVQAYGPIDLLYIDAWHREDKLAIDWQLYGPLLRPGALVILDDVAEMPPSVTGVVAFYESLPGEKFIDATGHCGIQMGYVIMPTPEPEPVKVEPETEIKDFEAHTLAGLPLKDLRAILKEQNFPVATIWAALGEEKRPAARKLLEAELGEGRIDLPKLTRKVKTK